MNEQNPKRPKQFLRYLATPTGVQIVDVGGLQLRSDDLVLHHLGEFRVVVRFPGVYLVEEAVISVTTDVDNTP